MTDDLEELERVSEALANLTDEEQEKELELYFQIKLDEVGLGHIRVMKVEKEAKR